MTRVESSRNLSVNALVTTIDFSVNADFVSLNGNPPCVGSVAAGEKCTLTFTIAPSVVGKEAATYSVYDNGGASPQILNLVGTGQ